MDQAMRLSGAIAQLDKPELHAAVKPSSRATFRLAKNAARLNAVVDPFRKTYERRESELKAAARADKQTELGPAAVEELERMNRDLGQETDEVDLIAIPMAEFEISGGAPGLIRVLAELDGFVIETEPTPEPLPASP